MTRKVFLIPAMAMIVALIATIIPADTATAGLFSPAPSPEPVPAQTEDEEALREDILLELNQAKQYTDDQEILDFLDAIINRVRNLEWVEFSGSAEDALETKYTIAKLIEELINELPIASAGTTAATAAAPSDNPLYEELVRIRAKIEKLIAMETPPEAVPPRPPEIERPPHMERQLVYSAKFLCGPAFGGEGVQRGSYSTAINVHNPHNATVILHKKAVIANREDDPRGTISAFRRVELGPDEAIEIDCADIVDLLGSQQPPTRRFTTPSLATTGQEEETGSDLPTLDLTAIQPVTSLISFIKGFVVIYATAPLDVVAVYTASTPVGFSLDVEYLKPSTVTTLQIPPPETEPECTPPCLCLTKEEAVKLGYTEWCNGEIEVCGYDEQQREKYCFTKPTEEQCPDGCVCLTQEKARELGYPICPGETEICGYDAQQNAMYCYRATTEEECPQGCICMTPAEAEKLGLSLCQNSKIECGVDAAGNVLYCYERPAETVDCPDECACYTDAEAKRLQLSRCPEETGVCGFRDGEEMHCYQLPEEEEEEECPTGCTCLTEMEAKRGSYTLCGGKRIPCEYVPGAAQKWCYERAVAARITITPGQAANPIGTVHTLIIMVYDAYGNPMANAEVTVTISGVNSYASDTVETNSSGEAEFEYSGKNPGSDIIKASIGGISATAYKEWYTR
ncbi:MAG: Ig-like domain-containing protein [Dehalococcoidales bacterium]|nr:Ig-like domain-containing protein [Dehalococcoidales bacterium]